MKRIKKTLRISIIVILLFGVSFSVTDSLAYWASGVSASSDVATATVPIGQWILFLPWDSSLSYSTGDFVTYNGTKWEAIKRSKNKEPITGSKWWQPYIA